MGGQTSPSAGWLLKVFDSVQLIYGTRFELLLEIAHWLRRWLSADKVLLGSKLVNFEYFFAWPTLSQRFSE